MIAILFLLFSSLHSCFCLMFSSAMIELIFTAKAGGGFSTDFPACDGDFGIASPCFSPLINATFAVCALSFVTL